MLNNKIYKAERGYDIVSSNFDQNKWIFFWAKNEAPFVQEWLGNIKKGFGLDAGAGTGIYLDSIVENGHDCIQLDISSKMLLVNKKKHSDIKPSRAVHLKARIDKRIFIENLFDWILCTRVLSHCKNLERQIATFFDYLKPDSECFISDIHPAHDYDQTGFRIDNDNKILIETYKHTIEDYKIAAMSSGFEILFFKEFNLNTLIEKPDSKQFSKLYSHPDNYIFFVLILKKP
jgi:2-polyprenyl-3-methyl-5-hydroxy-6-metoxy-1,4-benzoquinol methylase